MAIMMTSTLALLSRFRACSFACVCIGAFCICMMMVPAAVLAASLQPKGFRTWEWGQLRLDLAPADAWVIDPVLSMNTQGDKIYKKKQDDPTIAGVAPFDIEYVFWREQFAEIHGYTQGSIQYNQLVSAAMSAFGKRPRREILANYERLTWRKDSTEISIVFWGDSDNNRVHLSMKSLDIEKDKRTWGKRAKKEKKSLLQRGW